MINGNDNIPVAQAVPVHQQQQHASVNPVTVQYAGTQGGFVSYGNQSGPSHGNHHSGPAYGTQSQQQATYPGYSGGGANDGIVVETIDKFNVGIRQAFVRKVYGILSVQLIVTFGIVYLFAYVETLRETARTNNTLFFGAFAVSIAALCCIACNEKAARTFPTNYGLLALFTVAEGLVLGVVSARYEPQSVTIAVAATAGIVFLLSLFACQTKYDFTGYGPYLYGAFWVIIIFGFFGFFFRSMSYLYAGAMVLLFCMYVVYDTQLIVGGSHKKAQFGIDDYVVAALVS